MPTLPKLKKAKSGKTKGSAIDSAQRELVERQRTIQSQIDALQQSIEKEQAPRSQPGRTRGGRDTTPGSTTRIGYIHGVTVAHPHRGMVVGPTETRRPVSKRPTMLREERNAARRQTVALVVFLAGAVIYALSHLLPS